MSDAATPAPAAPAPAAAPAVAAPAPAAPAPTTLLAAAMALDNKPADAGAPAQDPPKNGEAAPDAGASADETDPNAQPDKPAERAAPEAYELKAPEGVTLDAETASTFEAVARELNMPQAEAQLLVERMAPVLQQRMAQQQAAGLEQASAAWQQAVESDKEIGGEQLKQNLSHAARAMKKLGTPEFAALLEDSRIGNHPEVVRFLVRAGKAMGDDKFIGGKAPPPAQAKSHAERLYPETT